MSWLHALFTFIARDVMIGPALTKPLSHYMTDPGCPDDPPLEEPVLTAWRDVTPFIDFLLERGCCAVGAAVAGLGVPRIDQIAYVLD